MHMILVKSMLSWQKIIRKCWFYALKIQPNILKAYVTKLTVGTTT